MVACGTFPLGSVLPQAGKSKDQQQLDTLTCKDKATLSSQAASKQIGDFLLGMTIIGVPVAYEMDKSNQRDIFKTCMEEKGYRVLPPRDDNTTTNTSKGAPTPATSVGISTANATKLDVSTKVKVSLPDGWAEAPLTDAMKAGRNVQHSLNRTTDSGLLLATVPRAGITDMATYSTTRGAAAASRLDGARQSQLTKQMINGIQTWQTEITGITRASALIPDTSAGMPITILQTIYEGRDEIIILNTWTSTANYQNQKAALQKIARSISGLDTLSSESIKVTRGPALQSGQDIGDKLTSLKALLDKGLITKEDYEAKKQAILNSM